VRLSRARVANYRSIEDSGWVDFDRVTCLVGKNESGKTAFLEALRKISPAGGASSGFDLRDYPRKALARYKPLHAARPADAVWAEFELSEDEAGQIEAACGPGVVRSRRVRARKNYRNEIAWEFDGPGEAAPLLGEFLPGLVYFDDYHLLRGSISIPDFRRRMADGRLDGADETFLALLRLAGTSLPAVEGDTDYESLKAELEGASSALTDEVLKYWSQNQQLRVEFDLAGEVLHLRIFNERHRVSVPFDERSRGFVWFFSFLAYFSQLEGEDADYVFLLDEPGLNLHPQAQRDLLRFIDERLAPRHPVIYTTHSPFLIHPRRLERVRTVEDVDGRGTLITADILSHGRDTRLPLEAAAGCEWVRSLEPTPFSLFVESASDLLYLHALHKGVVAAGRPGLDPRWEIVPVGGAGKSGAFATLMGSERPSCLSNLEELLDARFYRRLAREAAGGETFSRYRAAAYLVENLDRLLGELDAATIGRAVALFERVNTFLWPESEIMVPVEPADGIPVPR